jgi:hypothetical protein
VTFSRLSEALRADRLSQEDALQFLHFVRQVGVVRDLQRRYFRNRDPLTLREAKAAEAVLDAMLERLADPAPDVAQGTLL